MNDTQGLQTMIYCIAYLCTNFHQCVYLIKRNNFLNFFSNNSCLFINNNT